MEWALAPLPLTALLAIGLAGPVLTSEPLAAQDGDPPRTRQDTAEFRHDDHRGVSCLTCHPSEETHGGLAVTRREDCLQCHHEGEAASACSRCHASSDLGREAYRIRRTLELSVGTFEDRSLPFEHARHGEIACGECHAEGPALSAGGLECATCHEEHHRPEASCLACHAEPADDAHPVEVAHVTCGGSGCHASMPFQRIPRSRSACLGCHQDLTDHRPGRPCTECHVMPQREPAAARAPAAAEPAGGTP